MAFAFGRSSIVITLRRFSIAPPSEARYDAMESTIAWDPPRATGQPTAWAAAPRTRPKVEVNGRFSGSIEWALTPANRALARAPENARWASIFAGTRARAPKRAIRRGLLGRRSGSMICSMSSGQSETIGPMSFS